MANDSYSQQALASDSHFQLRVRAALATVAWIVIEEDAETANHAARAAYARSVINNLQFTAVQIAPWLTERPNLMLFETSYSFPAVAVVTAAGDADIQSQLLSDWNDLAGLNPTTPALLSNPVGDLPGAPPPLPS